MPTIRAILQSILIPIANGGFRDSTTPSGATASGRLEPDGDWRPLWDTEPAVKQSSRMAGAGILAARQGFESARGSFHSQGLERALCHADGECCPPHQPSVLDGVERHAPIREVSPADRKVSDA